MALSLKMENWQSWHPLRHVPPQLQHGAEKLLIMVCLTHHSWTKLASTAAVSSPQNKGQPREVQLLGIFDMFVFVFACLTFADLRHGCWLLERTVRQFCQEQAIVREKWYSCFFYLLFDETCPRGLFLNFGTDETSAEIIGYFCGYFCKDGKADHWFSISTTWGINYRKRGHSA